MVLFFASTAVEPPATIYMGRDKVENEDLLKHGDDDDVWFHVDKLSSAHVYLRLRPGMTWETIPPALLNDLGQLVKANSIEGNRKDNVTIIYTPWRNVKKQGDMAIGSVMFHNDQKVRRHFIAKRENAIVNRLNKTKEVREVDYAEQRIERDRARGKAKREIDEAARRADEEQRRRNLEEKQARDYSSVYSEEAMQVDRLERERLKRAKAQEREERGEEEDTSAYDSDEDFM